MHFLHKEKKTSQENFGIKIPLTNEMTKSKAQKNGNLLLFPDLIQVLPYVENG